MTIKNYYWLLTALALISCANYSSTHPSTFNVAEIACTDQSTHQELKDLQEKFEHLFGDAWRVAGTEDKEQKALYESEGRQHMLDFAENARPLADRGNAIAIWLFAGAKYYSTAWEALKDQISDNQKQILLPENIKSEITLALSYLYIARLIPSDRSHNIDEMIEFVEQTNTITDYSGKLPRDTLKTPPQWITEAKANAAAWQAYCSSQGIDVTSPHSPSPAPLSSH